MSRPPQPLLRCDQHPPSDLHAGKASPVLTYAMLLYQALQMVVVTSLLSPNTSPPSSLTDLITTPSRVSLPVHSRYQQPSLLSSFASVRVAPPMLLASCPPEGNSDATSDGWDWRAVR
eukprot:3867385-Rhodomonas_salina.1